jgi:SET domain-containing protein
MKEPYEKIRLERIMFYIKTKIDRSKIHGLGLFAMQNVEKGDKIYKHNDNLDLLLTKDKFEILPEKEKKLILHYGYIDKKTGKYRLDHDDIRFVNHSKKPNIGLNINGIIVALRDIKKGEELTQNYSEFGLNTHLD